MKTSERHHLKENDFATTVAHVSETLATNQRSILLGGVALLVVAILGAGYWYWQRQQLEEASALLAAARVIATAPITPPQLPTINGPAPPPQPGGFPTESARDLAALQKFREAAATFPSTQAGLAAQYQVGSLLAEMGKLSEAEQAFADVIKRSANSLYGRMSRLGVATLQLRSGRVDPAIQTLQELSQRTDTDLPVDGILMQLGDAFRRAGRMPEAIRAYTRIIDEFPESAYASDARAEADQLKAQAGTPKA